MLVRLQSRNDWSASDPFGGLKVWGFGGGEEREAGRFENGFRLLLLLIRGEREETEERERTNRGGGRELIFQLKGEGSLKREEVL